MDEKDNLIRIISSSGNSEGDKLIDFLEKYDVVGLKYATVDQLKEYIEMHLQLKEYI